MLNMGWRRLAWKQMYFTSMLEDLFVCLYWRLEFLFCSLNMHQITCSNSLGIALQRSKCTEQVFVGQDNISLSDMPATGKLGPISHYTNKLFKCILDWAKLPPQTPWVHTYMQLPVFSCAPRQYCGKLQLQFRVTTSQSPAQPNQKHIHNRPQKDLRRHRFNYSAHSERLARLGQRRN